MTAFDRWGAVTHEVANVPPPLVDVNLYTGDPALMEAVRHHTGANPDVEADLTAFGALAGSADYLDLGFQANADPPTFTPHDGSGHRVDRVDYHPAYHALMASATEHGLHCSHWDVTDPHAHVVRSARYVMQSQVEMGHLCPITMTSAAIPTLRHADDLYPVWAPKVTARGYDPRNVAAEQKSALTIGMAMTEKQGGSDVRANTTRALRLPDGLDGEAGPGGTPAAYELVGHKYFVSAPMSDAFLVLAQAPGGLSCFLLPRWRPDGTKNPLQIQRLKPKMGNVSNASGETELRGALAWIIGEEGRGVRTIIDMVAMTRFDCLLGSAAGMRAALAQAAHHASHRAAFGALLREAPLMRNVLADLAVESEAATALALRMADAQDVAQAGEESARLLVRIGTAVGKYWVCKRAPGHAYEAMECIGGSGVMQESLTSRLFRDSPINAIWEGSGNIQCLDLIRAMRRTPKSLEVLLAELDAARGTDARYDAALAALHAELADPVDLEYRSREIIERIALTFQAAILLHRGHPAVTEAFLASRLSPSGAGSGRLYGTLPRGLDLEPILERATG